MGKLDLNSAIDFAKLTMSDASNILQDFTGKNPNEWDILEGSYNGVLFHVFKSKEVYDGALSQITDVGGRRKVKYRFPYKDGQTTDDLGRKPEQFDLDILIFGPRYMVGLQNLMKELNKPQPGKLVHPILGAMTVVPEDWSIVHSSEKRKAATLRLVFLEHNFTIGEFKSTNDATVKGALARALDAFKAVERAIVTVTGAIQYANDVRKHITSLLSRFQGGYAQTLGRINKTYNTSGSADIPGLLPVNEGGTLNSDGSASDNVFSSVSSPSDPFSQVPIDSLSQATSSAVATSQLVKETNSLRADLEALIAAMKAAGGGQGSLDFYDTILELKGTAILLQDALERGIASSQAQIVSYLVPRVMSLREVAFANGIPVERVFELELLNPSIQSYNYVEKGTELKVPTA